MIVDLTSKKRLNWAWKYINGDLLPAPWVALIKKFGWSYEDIKKLRQMIKKSD